MISTTEKEIEKLTENLPTIRKVAGWSSEELGDLIGVTKQTISNIETHKSQMSKTQYIAIRAVIDYEIQENPDNELLKKTVSILLDSDDSPESKKSVIATRKIIEGNSKFIIGTAAFVGALAALEFIPTSSLVAGSLVSGAWLSKIINKKNKKSK